MGDIADWLIDQELDYGGWWGRPQRRDHFSNHPTHCNRCGAVCYWTHTGVRWALSKDGKLHSCGSASLSEFEDVS